MRTLVTNAMVATLLISTCAFGRDDKATATALLEKAWATSDIRADGSPPFRLEATFRTAGKSAKESDGHYTEIWISKTRWRRELETSSLHTVEIGRNKSQWSSGSQSGFPGIEMLSVALFGRDVMLMTESPKVTGVSQRDIDGVKLTCAESKERWGKITDCFDPVTGAFLYRKTHYGQTCIYRNNEKLGDHIFPRSVRCTSEPHREVDLTIVKLAPETSPDENLFVPQSGAIETANCIGKLEPPKLTDSPDPRYPAGHQDNVTVILSTVVSREGRAENTQVTETGGSDFDPLAIAAIQRWSFKPSKCDGEPVPVGISIQVNFRYR